MSDEVYDYGKMSGLGWGREVKLTKEQHDNLKRNSERVCKKFEITNHEAHFAFLLQSIEQASKGRAVAIEGGMIKPDADQPKLSGTLIAIRTIAQTLQIEYDRLFELLLNDTALALIESTGEVEKFPNMLAMLGELVAFLEYSSDHTPSRGRPTKPNWLPGFLSSCQEFWSTHKGGGTRITYHNEHTSKISQWTSEVFGLIQPLLPTVARQSTLQTAAKYHPALKP